MLIPLCLKKSFKSALLRLSVYLCTYPTTSVHAQNGLFSPSLFKTRFSLVCVYREASERILPSRFAPGFCHGPPKSRPEPRSHFSKRRLTNHPKNTTAASALSWHGSLPLLKQYNYRRGTIHYFRQASQKELNSAHQCEARASSVQAMRIYIQTT